jgi:predicted transcriptional regulator YheO
VFEEHQLNEVFDLLARVAEGIAALAGVNVEVAVHDLRTPHHGILANYGSANAPERAPTPQPLVAPAPVGLPARDLAISRVELPFGGEAGQATVWVRDVTGHVVGALVLRVDYSDILTTQSLLQRLLPVADANERARDAAAIGANAEEAIGRIVRETVIERRTPLHALDRDGRIAIIRELDHAGVFAVRHAADIVARELAISRASVYTYLRAARGD